MYAAVDGSGGFYATPCSLATDRSRMNVPFSVCGGETRATEAFLREAYARNMVSSHTRHAHAALSAPVVQRGTRLM